MCKDCATPDTVTYQGKVKILEHTPCACDCKEVERGPKGPRCLKCGHLVRNLTFTDDSTAWEEHPLWMPYGHPIRLDEVKGV